MQPRRQRAEEHDGDEKGGEHPPVQRAAQPFVAENAGALHGDGQQLVEGLVLPFPGQAAGGAKGTPQNVEQGAHDGEEPAHAAQVVQLLGAALVVMGAGQEQEQKPAQS